MTGNPGLMTINANYGLGESVVSGTAEPDNISVSRSWSDELLIKTKEIGAKATLVTAAPTGKSHASVYLRFSVFQRF